ncbi:MAG: hypothetical protein ACI398_07005 [Clostridium sp.]
MSRLGIKYDGCKTTVDDLKIISNSKYSELISDLEEVVSTIEGLTYKPETSSVRSSISKAQEHKEKIMNFANGLDSYAESLYSFDNGFYNNFVKLDGTNSDNYNINIGQVDITDEEIEELFLNDADSLESLLYKLNKDLSLGDDSMIIQIKDQIRQFFLSDENPKALKYFLRGNSFKVIRKDGDVFIKLKKSWLDTSDLEKCAKYLHDELNILTDSQLNDILSGHNTRNIRKIKKFINRAFSDEGVKIYDASRNNLSSYAKKLSKSDYVDLNKFIGKAELDEKYYFAKNIKDAALDDLLGEAKYIKNNAGKVKNSIKSGNVLNDIKNIKGASKLEFVGKTFGAIDKINTVWDNANESLKDENGNWDFTNGYKNKKFVVDTTVDLGTSAGAAALGAAIGSFIPGAGTVVGAFVGAAISIGINREFGNPPKSTVDHVKDWTNKATDTIGNTIGKIFW